MQTSNIGKIATATSYSVADMFLGGDTGTSGVFTGTGTSTAGATLRLTVGGVNIDIGGCCGRRGQRREPGRVHCRCLGCPGRCQHQRQRYGRCRHAALHADRRCCGRHPDGLGRHLRRRRRQRHVRHLGLRRHACRRRRRADAVFGPVQRRVGSASAINVVGTFASGADLATAISTQTGVAANYSGGVLSLGSSGNLTLAGTLYRHELHGRAPGLRYDCRHDHGHRPGDRHAERADGPTVPTARCCRSTTR